MENLDSIQHEGMKPFIQECKKLQLHESRLDRNFRIFKQVLMVMGVCLSFLSTGMMAAWPNPALADLRATNTTIYGTHIHLTPTEEDMIGSIVSAGAILGTWLGGIVVALIGRRRSVMLLLLPCLLGWGLISLAVNPAMMLAGRFINGMSCGLTTISAYTYIVELPDTSVRGAMAVLPNLFLIFGFIFDVGLGFVLRWFQIPFLSIVISTICLISMFFLPESPSYLIVKGKEEQARQLLISLRSPTVDVNEELKILRELNSDVKKESLFRVIRQPAILTSMAIVVTVFFIHSFSGLTLCIVNTTRLFHASGSNIDEGVATLLVFGVQLIGVSVSIYFLDLAGRRKCLIFSLAVCAVALLVFGAYLYCKQTEEIYNETAAFEAAFVENNSHFLQTPNTTSDRIVISNSITNSTLYYNSGWTHRHTWVPVMCLVVFMLSASVGVMPVPFVLASEYFPTAVRSQISSCCVLINYLFNMMALSLFTPLQTALTPAGNIWLAAAVDVFGVFFCCVFVRETKGTHIG